MKKPQMTALLLVLLLALLIPIFYRDKGTQQYDQQNTEINSIQVDLGDKSNSSPDVQTNIGEKASAPDKQPDSQSGSSTSKDNPDIPPGVNPVDSGQSLKDIRVAVAVVGKSGELLFGPANVSLSANGLNALSVLAATGLPYVMSPRYPDLVVSVAGQQSQGQSGWMYKVNNEIPGVAASKKAVVSEDCVIWWYSKSLNAPSPDWGNLSTSESSNGGG